jgi:hypothetical protein
MLYLLSRSPGKEEQGTMRLSSRPTPGNYRSSALGTGHPNTLMHNAGATSCPVTQYFNTAKKKCTGVWQSIPGQGAMPSTCNHPADTLIAND